MEATMPTTENNLTVQQARQFSTRLGELAAAQSPRPLESSPSSRLSAILAHFSRRQQARDDLRTAEFIAPE